MMGRRPRVLTQWLNFTEGVHVHLETKFEALGRFTARRPCSVLAGSVLCACLMASGIVTSWRERADFLLWVPSGSAAAMAEERYLELWPPEAELGGYNVIAKAAAGGSVLEQTTLQAAMELYDSVNALRVKRALSAEEIGLLDVCYRPSPIYPELCYVRNGLMAWKDATAARECLENADVAGACTYALDSSSVETDHASLLARVNNEEAVFSDFFGGATGLLSPLDDWGAITWGGAEPSDRVASDVGGIRMHWVVENERLDEESQLALALGFEDALASLAVKYKDTLDITYLAPESVEREFYGASVGSGTNMAVGTLAMFLFAILTLGKMTCLEGRKLVALVGIFSVWLAVAAAFGVSMYCGYIYTPFSQFMPLLALGLGVDDMYIIVSALDATDRTLPLEDRFGQAMRHAGVSITLTSVTDFVAFLLGSTTPIPAMKFFCFHMAVAVLFDLIFQCTFFVGALVLDQRRLDNGKRDCCCCLPPASPSPSPPTTSAAKQAYVADGTLPRWSAPMAWFFRSGLSPLLGSRWFACACVAFSVAAFALGLYGMASLEVSFGAEHILFSDSFALKFIEMFQADFMAAGVTFFVVIEHATDGTLSPAERYDYPQFSTDVLPALDASLGASTFVEGRGMSSDWLAKYDSWCSCAPCCDRHCALCAAAGGGDHDNGDGAALFERCPSCAYVAGVSIENTSSCVPEIGVPALAMNTSQFHKNLVGLLTDPLFADEMRFEVAYDESCSARRLALSGRSDEDGGTDNEELFAAQCGPLATRIGFQLDDSYQTSDEGNKALAMLDIRKRIEKIGEAIKKSQEEDDAFVSRKSKRSMWPYNDNFVSLELYVGLHEEVYRSIFLVSGVVLLVSLVLLVHPTLSLIVGVALLCICVDTLGLMYWCA